MKILAAVCAAACALFATSAIAQETTYTFTGGLYTSITNATNCTVGDCATYTTSQRPVVTLTFAAPLAANLPRDDLSASVIAYTLSDGVRRTVGPGPNAALFDVDIGTDGAGLPSNYSVYVQRTPGPPYPINTPTDPNSRFSWIHILPDQNFVRGNFICGRRGRGPAAVSGPGICNNNPGDAGTSYASSSQATVVTSAITVTPPVIPTMTEWAMILFGIILAGGAALMAQRRRMTT